MISRTPPWVMNEFAVKGYSGGEPNVPHRKGHLLEVFFGASETD